LERDEQQGVSVQPLRRMERKLPILTALFAAGISLIAAEVPDFNATVQPILQKHCLDCHAAADAEKGLVLESFETLMKGGESGASIVAGKSADSLLVKFLEGRSGKTGKNQFMPPGKAKKLEPAEIAVIKAWIDAGARAPKEAAKVATRDVTVPKIVPKVAPPKAIHSLAVAAGSGMIALAQYGEVELRSAETHKAVRVLGGHRGHVNAVAFSSDGKMLASAAGEPALFGQVKLWNVADGTLVRMARFWQRAVMIRR
jgi:WD40 repeat protein